jgi:succinate dehydrogenase/fumarate reductase flavoprotein subunit
MVEAMTQRVVDEMRLFWEEGVDFLESGGKPHTRWAAGHSKPRMINTRNSSGAGFTRFLVRKALAKGVTLLGGITVASLLKDASGRCAGALAVSAEGLSIYQASAVILATGGGARAYARSDNPRGAVGDGYGLAYQAGVPLVDMEFVQFYPVCLAEPGRAPLVIIYDALLEAGARLENSEGQNIPDLYGMEGLGSLTRDALGQAIWREVSEGRGVNGGALLDITTIPAGRAGRISHLWPKGTGRYKVAPACHFFMGGVVASPSGETEVPGLFAAGEVVGGVHGANRLAGNALAEAWALGRAAGEAAAASAMDGCPGKPGTGEALEDLHGLALGKPGRRSQVPSIMWEHVSLERCRDGLIKALALLDHEAEALSASGTQDFAGLMGLLEDRWMLLAGEMVTRSALAREESRGAHSRSDHPAEDPSWRCPLEIRRGVKDMRIEPRLG